MDLSLLVLWSVKGFCRNFESWHFADSSIVIRLSLKFNFCLSLIVPLKTLNSTTDHCLSSLVLIWKWNHLMNGCRWDLKLPRFSFVKLFFLNFNLEENYNSYEKDTFCNSLKSFSFEIIFKFSKKSTWKKFLFLYSN